MIKNYFSFCQVIFQRHQFYTQVISNLKKRLSSITSIGFKTSSIVHEKRFFFDIAQYVAGYFFRIDVFKS